MCAPLFSRLLPCTRFFHYLFLYTYVCVTESVRVCVMFIRKKIAVLCIKCLCLSVSISVCLLLRIVEAGRQNGCHALRIKNKRGSGKEKYIGSGNFAFILHWSSLLLHQDFQITLFFKKILNCFSPL